MWRKSNDDRTGSNNMPLGNRRRGFANAITDGSGSDWQQSENGSRADEIDANGRFSMHEYSKRSNEHHTIVKRAALPRKRKQRWGDPNVKEHFEGMPTAIIVKITEQELEQYALAVRLEEIGRKLRGGNFVPPEHQRSPSPEPMYDSLGRRSNTREQRYREKLEDERHKLISKAIEINPDFRPPADYKRPSKFQDKVWIPDREFPEINFIGLLIGPRGNTLKTMERDSAAKISIRGRGSVKEGKGRSDAASTSNQEEDLHCLVTADSEAKVAIAVKAINKIIETAASVPEGQNELKRNQLRELAALNGTLRDDENQVCPNCGGIGHRRYDCPERQNFTASIVCRICNGTGHMARDCTQRHNGGQQNNINRDEKLDSEYMNLMAELGENVPGQPKGDVQVQPAPAAPWAKQITGPPGSSSTGPNANGSIPPWQQQSRPSNGEPAAAPWQNQNTFDQQAYAGYDPSAPYGGYDYETYTAAWMQYYQQYGYPADMPQSESREK